MSAKRQIRQNLEEACAVWNRAHPIGTPVNYWQTAGRFQKPKETRTTSVAWVLNSHEIVVFVEGVSDYVAVSHVQKREGSKQ